MLLHPHQQQQQHHHYMQMANGYSCLDEGAVYYQVLNSQGVPCYVQAMETAVAVAENTTSTVSTTSTTSTTTSSVAGATSAPISVAGSSCTTTNSTSSMLCISSEMSIPMGRVNACEATTTTTTTTTHQYDDVACQQLRRRSSTKVDQEEQQQQQQMLQVRPRGIAYVIQFSVVDGSSQILPEMLSLQDQLQRARPQFCAKSKQRKAILNQMQLLRNLRRRELDELIETTSLEMLDRRLDELPPPVTCKWTGGVYTLLISLICIPLPLCSSCAHLLHARDEGADQQALRKSARGAGRTEA